jgi:DNA helicase HerA-like ATPase
VYVVNSIPVVLYVVLEYEKDVAIDVVVVVSNVVVDEVEVVVLYVITVLAKVTPRKLDAKSARVLFPAPVYPVTVIR